MTSGAVGPGDSPTRTASISSGSASSSRSLGPVLHAQHGIAGAHRVAHGRGNHDTDRRIDLIIYFVTAAAEHHRRPGRCRPASRSVTNPSIARA